MREENVITINLFVASGAETEETRKKITDKVEEFSQIHDDTRFAFKTRKWEYESGTVPPSGRSQDEYNKKIDKCDMVAVIIKNTLGKFTIEEFDRACERFRETGSPKIAVYVLPTVKNHDERHNFLKHLGEIGYFHVEVENDDQLIDKIKGELLRIKIAREAELESSVLSVKETLTRLELNGELTDKAVELFNKGDYRGANNALDIAAIRELTENLSKQQKEAAEAFVLKAKLVLTEVGDKARFKTAAELFDEAVNASRSPEILFECAYYCKEQNMSKKAEKLYTEALEIYRKLAADNPDEYSYCVANTLNNLANLHSDNNEHEKAEREYGEALELRRKLAADNPDEYNPDVADTLNNLAVLHKDNNKYEEAEREYGEALEIRRKLAADNPDKYNPYVADTLNNLANLHSDNNKHEKAEREYGEALEILRKLAADNPDKYNPDVAMMLNNLAVLHDENNEHKKAEREFKEALELYRKLAADNPDRYNPDLATTLNNLANLHSDNNKRDEAEGEFGEALEIRRELATDNPDRYNPDVAQTLNNLACLHSDNNEYEEAEREFKESLELYRKLAADNPDRYNPDLATTLNNLANLHFKNNKHKEAEREYREALKLITPFYNKNPNAYKKLYDMINNNLNILLVKT